MTPFSMRGSSFATSRPPVTFSCSQPRIAARASPLFATITYLLSEPETRFAVANVIRPVGEVECHLLPARVGELDQQVVAPPLAREKAQAHEVARAGRGRRVHEPVADDLDAHLPEVPHGLAQKGQRHVPASRQAHEVEHVAVLTLGGVPEHRVPEQPTPNPHAEHRDRLLRGAWPVAPPEEGRVLLWQAGDHRRHPLEELVEGLVEAVYLLDLQAAAEAVRERGVDPLQTAVHEVLEGGWDRGA